MRELKAKKPFFEKKIAVRLHKDHYKMLEWLMIRHNDLYKNRSHIIRVAINKLYFSEKMGDKNGRLLQNSAKK